MSMLKRIITGLSIIILTLGCGALLLFGWSGTGWKALIVPTGSMRPAIMPGSLVLVHHVPPASLKVGQVITYINPLDTKTTVTHRIVSLYLDDTKTVIITKGDANKIDDVPISASSVQGKVVWHIPKLGYILLAIKKPIIILPVIYLAAIFIMTEEVIRLRNYYKLDQPYILAGYKSTSKPKKGLNKRLALGFSLSAAFILISFVAGSTVSALLKSNTVSLVGNRITATSTTSCSGNTNNNNTVIVTNNNGQTSTTGNSSNSGGNGSATSGNSTNNSSTSISITLSNC